MKFSVFQVSRKGGRKLNEDRMGYCYTRETALFLLADGMGGHPEGEVAAQLALQTVAAQFQKEAQPVLSDVSGFLSAALLSAHRQILRYAMDRGVTDSPRTTIVMAVLQDGQVSWAHCGDSRLYLVRASNLLVRTKDHSLIEHSMRHPAEASGLPTTNRNVLFSCLGSPTKPVFSVVGPVSLMQSDRVMLCSDGLWSTLSDDEIVFELSQKPVDLAVPDLVEKALKAGGENSDNVTCIALEWETPDQVDSIHSRVSTDTISEGVFASTLQAGVLDESIDDMDEAAIERSIAEINEAIRRSAVKKS
ncbi:MAG: serine/threonine-protein phosphatase [Betaproteobacteria bacterium]|nr:serine/threonine-protein phosphatase [Betaproteobacteria bacterium]NCP81428.1 serine/threonine-protein phosphatase [Rhodoferax sp.]NCS60656.1 serine/threonine-protein phosphatase [Rhodoferax sp.]OIP12859.1 MAG: serine/threonine protein phosphatase [Comamonadaceae bacterium CG2_30_57_122]PIZ23001.1 MAG: serine/threonine protein phosphatase [Comamonadaceae bacterium CG_4_10_14_0_8_um_filter_57_29]